MLKQKLKDTSQKPQGRKHIHQPRKPKYTRWQTPFLWAQIVAAGEQEGPRMSASEIVCILKRKDHKTFDGLNRTTVDGWIDRSGNRPTWKKTTLLQAEKGDENGHNKGGRRGILVSIYTFLADQDFLPRYRRTTLKLSLRSPAFFSPSEIAKHQYL
jgi:hypothetical protein